MKTSHVRVRTKVWRTTKIIGNARYKSVAIVIEKWVNFKRDYLEISFLRENCGYDGSDDCRRIVSVYLSSYDEKCLRCSCCSHYILADSIALSQFDKMFLAGYLVRTNSSNSNSNSNNVFHTLENRFESSLYKQNWQKYTYKVRYNIQVHSNKLTLTSFFFMKRSYWENVT